MGFEPGASHPGVEGLTAHLAPQVAAYLWAELGFTLHRIPARRMLVCVGPPAAGKTHLIRALLATLGPLASRVGGDLLKASQANPGAPTTHLRPMVGGRVLAAMDEPPKGRIDSERLKELTGAGGIAYRTPYATQQVDREITASLIVGANHGALPHMGLSAAAVRARVRIIPFPEIAKSARMGPGEAEALYGDPDFRAALLGRLIEEARACVVDGSITKPTPPPAVEAALKAVIEEQGGPAYEVAQRVEEAPGGFLPTAAQWEAQLQLDPSLSEKGKGARTREFWGVRPPTLPRLPPPPDHRPHRREANQGVGQLPPRQP